MSVKNIDKLLGNGPRLCMRPLAIGLQPEELVDFYLNCFSCGRILNINIPLGAKKSLAL